jgi:hypothetical protein
MTRVSAGLPRTTGQRDAGDRRVLEDPPAEVLERPGIGLDRPLGIGVPAVVGVGPAQRVIPDDRHQLLQLLRGQEVGPEATLGGDLPGPSEEGELVLVERHPDPVGLVLGGVPEQLVHLRPEPLLLEPEGAVDVGRATAVASGGLPAHDALLEHEDVDAGAREPPASAQASHAATDDDHCRAPGCRHGGPIIVQ